MPTKAVELLAKFRAGEITILQFFQQAEHLPLSELHTLSGLLMGGVASEDVKAAGESDEPSNAA